MRITQGRFTRRGIQAGQSRATMIRYRQTAARRAASGQVGGGIIHGCSKGGV